MDDDFEELRKQLDHIVLEFQLSDIERALTLARANFLAMQGLVVCVEFLGGIRTGTLGDDQKSAKERYESGLQLLGRPYSEHTDELWSLRNGLLHSYLPKGKPGRDYVIDNIPSSSIGFMVEADSQSQREKVTVNTPGWLRALNSAYLKLLDELRANPEARARAKEALERLPGLA